MAVCGCGQSLAGAPPILENDFFNDEGIIISGTFDNTIVTAADATAWRFLNPALLTLTNFTLGNGIFNGRYLRNGHSVDLIMSFEFGTTSTFAAAPFEIGPIGTIQDGTLNIPADHAVLGYWSVFDAGSPGWRQGYVAARASSGTGRLIMRVADDAGGSNSLMQQPDPITFSAGDELSLQVKYEIE